MTATRTTLTHPSHHPPNAIPAPADAALSTAQRSEESAPFTDVEGRSRKARNAQSKRVSPQQTTLSFSGAPSATVAFSPSVVSVDIADRVEQTMEGVLASAHVERRTAHRATAPAASADTSKTVRLKQLTSSSRATQHSSPSPSHASTRPACPNGGMEQEDNRMRDIAAAAKRARELDPVQPPQATAVAAASSGHIHPERLPLMGDGAPTHSAAGDSGKEEADPSSGQDKRRRTAPSCSAASSTHSPAAAVAARGDAPPTVEEYSRVVAELHASRKESSDLRARLELLERRVEALLSASPAATEASPLVARAVPSTRNNTSATASPVPASSAPTAGNGDIGDRVCAAHLLHSAASQPVSTPWYSPRPPCLSSLSLSPYSSTDLMLNVSLPPTTIKMARGHFPNHATQPANHRMGIVNLLQGANGLQLLPPRVPLFMAKAQGERDCIATLQQSYPPDSREHRYLDCLLQADRNGDECDPCQHSFSDAECVTTWHQLLTLETRVVSSQHQRKLYIRLALLSPVLTVAVTAAVAAHMQHVQLSVKASQSRHQVRATGSGTTSPTPSVASTASSTSTEEQAHPSSSDMEDTESDQPPSPLRQGAMHCTVSVSPFRLRYAMCTVSNWPRAHPTELCASNHHLAAFVRQHAPDVRLVTKEENGMTSGSVTAYCQQRHLPQLTGLNGRVSDEHGIHFPLRLHTTIHVMGAKTCTFCWQPNHGATHCPRRASSTNTGQHLSATPACRHCYSFGHTSDACTSTATKECTLCKKQAHSTSQCAHFFPSRVPVQQNLTPVPNKQQQQQKVATEGMSGVPAPILSSAHSNAARPWHTNTAVSETLSPAVVPHAFSQPVQHQQARFVSEFVTPGQLPSHWHPS